MKFNIYYLVLGIIFFGFACEGPVGPQGPQGAPGENGADGLIGYTFDFEGVDFTASNDFTVFLPFNNFEVFDSDVVLTYILWDVDGNNNPIWRLLPQTIFTDMGLLQYNTDFTVTEVSVFLRADFDLNMLGAGYTDNQFFRVVVIPADFASNGRIGLDVSDYYAVAERYGLTTAPVDDKYKELLKRGE